MDEAAYLRLIRGEKRGPVAASARLGLWAVSVPYGAVVATRNVAFDRGWKHSHQAEVPVVSVGNLTLGGTGKTPTVEWVARRFREEDLRVAIMSRGYGQTEGLNDEGRVLEENLPDVPHLQGKDRVALARIAVEELESQILVLDDGFQHRRLARDLDIVLLDAFDPFGLRRLFPRGLLRESPRSLRRAGVVMLTHGDTINTEERSRVRAEAERWAGKELSWVVSRHAPIDLVESSGQSFPLEDARKRRVAAFCGIGNPRGFEATLKAEGIEPAAFRAFPDHHPYSAADVADLASWAKEAGADLALTTQKDSVKLRSPSLGGVPLRALRIGLDLLEGEQVLRESLARIVSRTR